MLWGGEKSLSPAGNRKPVVRHVAFRYTDRAIRDLNKEFMYVNISTRYILHNLYFLPTLLILK
jgi:hypothetical protein